MDNFFPRPEIVMSLHAELNEEAAMRLRTYRRNSVISSLVISVLTLVLIGLVLGIFLLPNLVKESPEIIVYQTSMTEETEQVEEKVQRTTERKPSSPSSTQTKVMVANTASPTTVPVPEVDVSTPSLDFGDGADFGTSWGDSTGDAGGFGKIPATMKKRCSPEDRAARMKEMGGTPQCEQAVMKALRWIKQTQNSDGSWGKGDQVAMTGFSLLVYLGHCETPMSAEFGDSVSRGITYLINNGMKNDGRMTVHPLTSIRWVYEHGIATYALAEAYTFCSKLDIDIPNLDTVTKKGAEIIMDGQAESGGWVYRYAPAKDGDNSVGYWQIQALKAASHTGLFPESKFKRHARKAMEWLEKAQGSNGAIGYRGDSKRSPGLTGGGVLCMQLWGEGRSKAARKGMDYLTKNMSFKWGQASSNLYYQYYNAQAFINQGGKEWDAFNNLFREDLLKAQAADGTWNQNMQHGPINVHMATCLATLMLEVYYRFLPGTGAATGGN
jgi:hypothetical protein